MNKEYHVPESILDVLAVIGRVLKDPKHQKMLDKFTREICTECTLAAEYRAIGFKMTEAALNDKRLDIEIAGIPVTFNSSIDTDDTNFSEDLNWFEA